MKITWLGQAGLLFEKCGFFIMIDPYFSDSVKKVNPKNFRRVPINDKLFEIQPDVMIFTHDHLDHYDPETAPIFLEKTEKSMTVLCPTSVWQKARLVCNLHNYVQFNPGTEWTVGNIRFYAVYAEHSDPYAIGVIIEDLSERKKYYITGDTLYNSKIFEILPGDIDVVFVPINGVGNNMNFTDAQRFCERVGAETVVPVHFGMFDEIKPQRIQAKRFVIPELYKEIVLD